MLLNGLVLFLSNRVHICVSKRSNGWDFFKEEKVERGHNRFVCCVTLGYMYRPILHFKHLMWSFLLCTAISVFVTENQEGRKVTMDLLQNLSSVKSNRLVGTTIWVSKIVLLTMGTISTVILFKGVIVPYTFSFIYSTFPPLLISVRSWLSVPFLYIIVNFIIISIVVSSNFHNKKQVSPQQPTKNSNSTDSTINSEDTVFESTLHSDVTENIDIPSEEAKEPQHQEETLLDSALSFEKSGTNPPLVTDNCDHLIVKEREEAHQEKELGHSDLPCAKSDKNPPLEKSSGDYVPLDSEEKCDDMEATWRAIMEREGKQVTWKLKKSETWREKTKPEPLRKSQVGEEDDHVAWARRELRKFDTFNDTASLKRDKSMSPEELYRQAEAFIQKINNQMRLQRLESEQRSMEMVNRSV